MAKSFSEAIHTLCQIDYVSMQEKVTKINTMLSDHLRTTDGVFTAAVGDDSISRHDASSLANMYEQRVTDEARAVKYIADSSIRLMESTVDRIDRSEHDYLMYSDHRGVPETTPFSDALGKSFRDAKQEAWAREEFINGACSFIPVSKATNDMLDKSMDDILRKEGSLYGEKVEQCDAKEIIDRWTDAMTYDNADISETTWDHLVRRDGFSLAGYVNRRIDVQNDQADTSRKILDMVDHVASQRREPKLKPSEIAASRMPDAEMSSDFSMER